MGCWVSTTSRTVYLLYYSDCSIRVSQCLYGIVAIEESSIQADLFQLLPPLVFIGLGHKHNIAML